MRPDAALAAAAGLGVAALAGLAGLFWLRRAMAGGKPLGPQALLGATALRFALTLVGALVLALGWRRRSRTRVWVSGTGAARGRDALKIRRAGRRAHERRRRGEVSGWPKIL
jgi:hypothetical protein